MRNYVIINGVNSLTIQGLAINNLPPITKPMIRTQREEIDGRDGDIVTELGYSAYDKQMEIGLYGNFDIDAIIKYFTGEGTIVFSNEADKYYNFKILDQIDYEKLLKFKTATITFHCQPFKYPLEEEPEEAEITTITGTGESITLENVEEAPMKIVYKGNTYQYSTSGKNLYDDNYNDYTKPYDYNICPITLETGQYTISATLKGTTQSGKVVAVVPYGDRYNDFSTQLKMAINGQGVPLTTIINVDETWTSPKLVIYANSETDFDSMFENYEIQLEKGNQKTSFEPYTNGASPNPDYPQPIQVVSGDNSIEICGKNLFDSEDWYTTYHNVNSTSMTKEVLNGIEYYKFQINNLNTIQYMKGKFKPNTSYTLSFKGMRYPGMSNGTGFTIRYTDGTQQYVIIDSVNEKDFSLTSYGDKTIDYIELTWVTSGQFALARNIMLVEGNDTTYQPYTGASYPINLGERFNVNKLEAGSYDGTNKNRRVHFFGKLLESGDIVKVKIFNSIYKYAVARATQNVSSASTNVYQDSGWQTGEYTFTSNGSGYFYLGIARTDDVAFSPSDLKYNDFSIVYGDDTPIELCKIGTYQDKIDKSTGKNLFNGVMELGIYDGDTGQPVSNNSYMRCKDYIPVDEQTKYVITSVDLSVELAVYEYKGDYSYNLTTNRVLQNGQSFTTNSGTKYIKFRPRVANTDLTSKFMVNKGTTALPYEPYGTSWYLKKEIEKELIRPDTATIENNGVRTNAVVPKPIEAYPLLFCNYFGRAASYNGATNANSTTPNKLGFNSSGQTICNILGYTTTTEYIDFFANNDVYVYYPLATPTYTLIEGELLNQLEAIKMSYEGQTNLSQTNNDLPFELDASVTFLTPMEINNIGNIYAKPILTIEGTGNIGVVLNGIQILDIDLSNNGKITIDVPKLEAYNPDDDTLLNRLVTGDYMKLLINEGENKITFTGEVSGATLTNYIRWI